MPIVKELSRAAAAPGSPPILGRAAQEIIRQGEEIERLQEVLRTIAFRAQDAKRLCEEGARERPRLTLPDYREAEAEHDTRDEGIGVIVWLFASFFFAAGFCAGWVFTRLPW